MSDNGDWLKALWTMGLIILTVTTLPGAAMLIYASITHTSTGINAETYALGSLLMSGAAAMIYASIKGNQKNKRKNNPEK